MTDKNSITEINMAGKTVINFSPDHWSSHGYVWTALVDDAVMIVKDWNGKAISKAYFKKNSKVTCVVDRLNSRVFWNAEDIISNTL